MESRNLLLCSRIASCTQSLCNCRPAYNATANHGHGHDRRYDSGAAALHQPRLRLVERWPWSSGIADHSAQHSAPIDAVSKRLGDRERSLSWARETPPAYWSGKHRPHHHRNQHAGTDWTTHAKVAIKSRWMSFHIGWTSAISAGLTADVAVLAEIRSHPRCLCVANDSPGIICLDCCI